LIITLIWTTFDIRSHKYSILILYNFWVNGIYLFTRGSMYCITLLHCCDLDQTENQKVNYLGI